MLRLDLNLVWTIINMLIIYAIYRKFLYQPVHKVLDARQAEIDKQYADAETARQSAEQLKEQAQAEMTEISRKKADMLGEARQKAGEEYDRLMKQAKERDMQVALIATDDSGQPLAQGGALPEWLEKAAKDYKLALYGLDEASAATLLELDAAPGQPPRATLPGPGPNESRG